MKNILKKYEICFPTNGMAKKIVEEETVISELRERLSKYEWLLFEYRFIESNVNRFEFSLRYDRSLVIINKLLKLVFVCVMQFSKAEKPLVYVHGVFVANGCRFQEIICIFFCFGFWNVFLDVFVKPDCFV